jgi:hypothetical protein
VELLGKVGDRSVCTPELLQNAASGDIRERGERGIEAGPADSIDSAIPRPLVVVGIFQRSSNESEIALIKCSKGGCSSIVRELR